MDLENNIRPDEPRKILFYGYDEKEREAITDFLIDIEEFNFLFVDESLLDFKVKNLVYNDEFENTIYNNIPDEIISMKFMLVSGFSNKEINNLSSLLKNKGFPRPLIATLTEQNRKLKFIDLLKEIHKEHNYVLSKLKQKQNNQGIP
ncbi:hypothetical protein CLOTH_09910 [Alkalithermobacter paradoxus]|uniref:Uncharacterized protein n=2 Tax=Alkalithermobacter paradoxus TaxID=29349 RepID=A0A1V4I790_9FIRM|nr:hypothetical protein CLOTH_09910 [[Clostridium] thermoalcaliphilum]